MNAPTEPVFFDTLDGVPDPRAHDLAIGHAGAHAQMRRAIAGERLPQAWLLSGMKGIGKASFAWHYARRLAVDAGGQSEPDPATLRAYAEGRHFQVHALAPPFEADKGFKSQIGIEAVRELSDRLATASIDGAYRIVIVDPAEIMTNAAANALLKLLEEPPARVLFFLITAAPHLLLPTIRSRCQQMRFAPLGDDEITRIWPQISDRPLPKPAMIALAEGSMRNALAMDEAYLSDYQRILQVLAGHADISAMFTLARAMAARGRAEGLERAANMVQFALGRALRRSTNTGETAEGSLDAIEDQAARVLAQAPERFAALAFEILGDFRQTIVLNLDAETVIFRALRAIDQAAKGQY